MLKKIVLTGARGSLGSSLRGPLAKMCKELVSTDIAEAPSDLMDNESWVQADLAQMDQVAPLMDGVEMVVHFGAVVDEKPFEELWGPNFMGSYNVWESAWQAGARRIVYASSVHAIGMHEATAAVDIDAPHRPDTFYGLAKCFTEDLGRLYWEKRGLESAHLRIFSCTKEPENLRALGTWLSHRDMVELVRRAVLTPVVGFTVVNGISANTRAPVRNDLAPHLGYHPQDNAEDWAEAISASAAPVDPHDPALARLGGPFAAVPLGQSGVDAIKAMGKARDRG